MNHLLMSSGYRGGELIITEGMLGSKIDDIVKKALSIFHSTTKEEAEREGEVKRRVLIDYTKKNSSLLRRHDINPDTIKSIVKRRVKKANNDIIRSIRSKNIKSLSKIMIDVVQDIQNDIKKTITDVSIMSLPKAVLISLFGLVLVFVATGLIGGLFGIIAPGLAPATITVIAALIVMPIIETYIKWLASKAKVLGTHLFITSIIKFFRTLIFLPFAPIAAIVSGLAIIAHYIEGSLVNISIKNNNPIMIAWAYLLSLLFGVIQYVGL